MYSVGRAQDAAGGVLGGEREGGVTRAQLPTLPDARRVDPDVEAIRDLLDALTTCQERIARIWPRNRLSVATVLVVLAAERGVEAMMGRVRG